MRKIMFFSLFICLINIACSTPKEEKSELGDFLSQCEELNLFSGSVLIMEKGEKVFEGNYGYRNFDTKEKNTSDSKYRAYSITKAFTATVVHQLVEEGKLSYTDKLSKFYPDFPQGDSISITNLLGHTSGIPNVVDTDKTKDEASFMSFIVNEPLEFAPNTSWNYSNSNYYVLGYIIEHVSGQSYDEAISSRILVPLGMNNSGFHFNELNDPMKTTGYSFLSKEHASGVMLYKTDHPFAAGSLYSTVGDLYKFSEALEKNTLLKKETMELASIRQNGSQYGLGYQLDSICGEAHIGHTGGGPGYVSVMFRVVERDITFIMMSNSQNLPFSITQKISDILLKQPYSSPAKSKIDPALLKGYEGIYEGDNSQFFVKVDDGVLTFNEKNSLKSAFMPLSDSVFEFAKEYFVKFSGDSITVNLFDGSIKHAKKTNKPFVWGIIGDATANGWGGDDILLETDAVNAPNVFFLRNYKLNKGGFQFRQNSDWSSALSLSANGDLIPTGYNIEVEEGIYDITLDMTNRLNPKYEVKKVDAK